MSKSELSALFAQAKGNLNPFNTSKSYPFKQNVPKANILKRETRILNLLKPSSFRAICFVVPLFQQKFLQYAV